MPMPANASCISVWYRSTISRGVTTVLLGPQRDGGPMLVASADPQNFRTCHAFEARSNVTGQVCAGNVSNVDGAIGVWQGRGHHQSAGVAKWARRWSHQRGEKKCEFRAFSLSIAILPHPIARKT